MVKRVLFSWVGHTDLRAMAAAIPAEIPQEVTAVAGQRAPTDGQGPLRTLLQAQQFDRVHVVSSYSPAVNTALKDWLGQATSGLQCHAVPLKNPSDHGTILACVQPLLEQTKLAAGDELCFYLSPGTPAMAAIWILLAKSKFPATLLQAYQGRVTRAEIPFDITVDVLPRILSGPDRFWQHLVDDDPHQGNGFDAIVGNSEAIRLAKGRAKRAALFDVTVLILGETGTGKEVFAGAIHSVSHRRGGPYVAINCAAINPDLLESELFGHVKGAFTGAERDKAGAFQLADGGTLFLDEVGECDLAMQAKLLRALQPPPAAAPCQRVFRRVGASEDTTANVRVVAATNRDLAAEVRAGNFREDLFYRLAMIAIKLPAVRHREGDAATLAERLLAQINDQFTRADRPGYIAKTLTAESLAFIARHDWPGNVRQLYNVLVQAAIMQDTPTLTPTDLASSIASIPSVRQDAAADIVLGNGFIIDEYLDQQRRTLIIQAMEQAGGVKSRAARLLGLKHYQTLDAQLKRLNVPH